MKRDQLKSLLLGAILLAGITLPAKAQIGEQRHNFAIGINGGANYSTVSFQPTIKQNGLLGITGGVTFLAHLAFGKDKGVQFFVNLGPQIGLLLNESEKRKGTWETANRAPNEQYGKWVENKFDYGIVGGGGIEVRTKAGNFLLEGRYYFGLADFYNSTKKDYFSRSANSTITAKITYLFDIKK